MDYHEAIDAWLKAHGEKTAFCLVQFMGSALNEMPKVYLASPHEIAEVLHNERAGHGDTILYGYKKWSDRGIAAGTIDKIPDEWLFSEKRVIEMIKKYA